MKIRDQTLNPMLEIPAVEVSNLIEEDAASRAFGWRAFVLRNQIQNALSAGEDTGMDRRLLIEFEHLRHVADHEISSWIEFARVRFHHARRNLEKRRFARTVAADQTNSLAFQNGNGGVIEHSLIAKPHHEFGGAGNGV